MEELPGTDAILIQKLEIQARVGVPDEERAHPQRLVLSLKLWPHAGFDQLQDQLERTVNYAAVSREVQEFSRGRADKLIETFANELAAYLLRNFALARVQIELRKFVLPEAEYVAVILTREQRGASDPPGITVADKLRPARHR